MFPSHSLEPNDPMVTQSLVYTDMVEGPAMSKDATVYNLDREIAVARARNSSEGWTAADTQAFLSSLVKRSPNFFNVRPMRTDSFMKFVPSYTKLLGPVGYVRGHLRINLFRVVRALGVIFVNGVRLVGFLRVLVLGHAITSFPYSLSMTGRQREVYVVPRFR